VKAACLDARRLGLEVCLVLDGTRAVNVEPQDGPKALAEVHAAGVSTA
jgi:nicotinamidase-related amidase